MADALIMKAQHSLNTVVITQMSLLKEPENLGVQLVSLRQASLELSSMTLQPFIVDEIQVN